MSEQPCTKRPYATRYEARHALLVLWKKGRSEMSTYLCPCGAWHLRSRKRRVP